MPDRLFLMEVGAAAALTAAALVLLLGWPWRSGHPVRSAIGPVLGIGLGLAMGCWLLGVRPKWRPTDDQDRLFFVLLPVVLAVELVAGVLVRQRWLTWFLRAIVAVAAARVLLHNTTYLSEQPGGVRKWTELQTWLVPAGLAIWLLAQWAALTLLQRRSPGRAVPLALAIACGGAGMILMMSGSASRGELGIPLAGALAGAALATVVLKGGPQLEGAVGIGVVGLFSLLIIGHFLNEMTARNAVVLFLVPLLAWLPELPPLRRVGPCLRGAAAVVLTAIPVALAAHFAYEKFMAEVNRPSAGTMEIGPEAYENYRK